MRGVAQTMLKEDSNDAAQHGSHGSGELSQHGLLSGESALKQDREVACVDDGPI